MTEKKLPKVIFEIDEDLKHQFTIWLVKNKLTQKDVLTEYIRKLVGNTIEEKEN